MRWRAAALLLVLAALGTPAGAQVVRGRVVERTTRAPLVGVVVELFADGADPATGVAVGERRASALSAADGTFAMRAPARGTYVVTAKRIGVRRWTSPPFTLEEGETRELSVVLEALDYRLPEVVVVANTLCASDPSQSARVQALWEEARTALDATRISLRDRLYAAEVTRYVRQLDPKTKRVVSESRSATRGVVASPFNSAPAESLSAHGYWQEQAGGGAVYHGPDAEVLLSDEFLRDHCFGVVDGGSSRRNQTGLAFRPVEGRPVPGVVGTMWLDARSFELRLVDFRYDRVRAGVDGDALGGELHFARLPNGAWLVERWFLRVPLLGRPTQPVSTEGSSPWVLVRPTTFTLAEEGGVVKADVSRPPQRVGAIAGVARDSAGRAMAGAQVRLDGTSRTAVADAEGRFVFDSLDPGQHAVRLAAPWYDSLGVTAAEVAVEVRSGERRRVELRAMDARAVTMHLCRGEGAPFGRGTLRLTVRDGASGAPIGGAPVRVTWMSTVGRAAGDSVPASLEGETDARGVATFCEVPAERRVTVVITSRGGEGETVRELTLRAREVRAMEVGVRHAR